MNALEITIPSKSVAAQVDVAALDTAKPLAEIFQPFQAVLEKWEAKATTLVVTDISQKTEMAQARLARLELKQARVTMGKTHKGLVEGLKARTGKIDEAARVIRVKIEGLEESLRASEEFAERYAEKVKSELKEKREVEMVLLMDTPILGDLSDLSESDYAKVLEDAKVLRQAKIDCAAKAEVERLTKEAADRAERERVTAENARLKAEAAEAARLSEIERQRVAAEREAESRKIESERALERKAAQDEAARVAAIATQEREAVEAKAREEANAAAAEQARLRSELAVKVKAEADEKARLKSEQLAAEKAAKKAAAAPDKAKLEAFAETVRLLPLPALSDPFVVTKLQAEIDNLATWIDSASESL